MFHAIMRKKHIYLKNKKPSDKAPFFYMKRMKRMKASFIGVKTMTNLKQTNTHRVVVFSDKTKTQEFPSVLAAVKYANSLLRQNVNCKIYPITERRGYTDVLIERELKERGQNE